MPSFILIVGMAFFPFYGILIAPLYLILILAKSMLVIIINPKIEEVELCLLEQHL
jgi:hypothetical protein